MTDAARDSGEGAGLVSRASAGPAARRLLLRLRRFPRDRRGVAAVEFGFIAPIMMIMLLGAVELTRAISIDRRFGVVTATIADLVTREREDGEPFTAAEINAIYDIAEQIMSPFDATPLKVSLIPVASHPNDAANTVVYPHLANRPSYNGGAQPPRCQAYPLPAGLLGTNEGVVVIEASYAFKPLFVGYLMHAFDWKERAFAKPRRSLCVDFGDKCGTCFN